MAQRHRGAPLITIRRLTMWRTSHKRAWGLRTASLDPPHPAPFPAELHNQSVDSPSLSSQSTGKDASIFLMHTHSPKELVIRMTVLKGHPTLAGVGTADAVGTN
ncbi:hypothetical protein CEXT_13021 [Caerostris extrusa]|uniref:Uncharacterized protein n=1 Tax=Caerostris extrusa TaxID=172846 RepID=A0AAV4VAT5_CAEEX|nr:hypothetical protein CEXT_13021 [Caerostris extrusa]